MRGESTEKVDNQFGVENIVDTTSKHTGCLSFCLTTRGLANTLFLVLGRVSNLPGHTLSKRQVEVERDRVTKDSKSG